MLDDQYYIGMGIQTVESNNATIPENPNRHNII